MTATTSPPSHVMDLVQRIWAPAGAEVAVTVVPSRRAPGGSAPADRLLVIGPPGNPRFVISPGRGNARALAEHQRLRATGERVKRIAAAGAVAAGITRMPRSLGLVQEITLAANHGGRLQRDRDLVHRYIGRTGGIDTPRCLLMIRMVDDHYKPTLSLQRQSGSIAGFAKLGWTQSTAEMVRYETKSLRQLGRSPGPGLLIPPLLGAGEHLGRPFFLTAPVPAGARRSGRDLPDATTMRALSGSIDRVPPEEVVHLDAAMQSAAQRGDNERARLLRRADEVLRDRWADGVASGRFHGDWVPWNTAVWRGSLIIWDWEHYRPVAPIGVDSLHWLMLSRRLLDSDSWEDAYRFTSERAAAAVSDLGVGTDARELLVFHASELIARSEKLRTKSGVEPFPLDDVLASLLRAVTESDVGIGS